MSARLPARVSAQLVLLSMGFVGSEERLFEEFKLAKAPNGSIAADDSSYATSVPGVFAAGDARRGQSLVVGAQIFLLLQLPTMGNFYKL